MCSTPLAALPHGCIPPPRTSHHPHLSPPRCGPGLPPGRKLCWPPGPRKSLEPTRFMARIGASTRLSKGGRLKGGNQESGGDSCHQQAALAATYLMRLICHYLTVLLSMQHCHKAGKVTADTHPGGGPPRGPRKESPRPDCCRSSMALRLRLRASSRWISSIVLGPSACSSDIRGDTGRSEGVNQRAPKAI